MAEEFAEVDFNEERLEKRFRRTMEILSKTGRNLYTEAARTGLRQSSAWKAVR
ncbi:MAG: hypothetical protein LBQ88_02250 [Treponema sp.]|jgi:hypothetical protein|nr:hypothetical protein [Treponema sp.]